MINGVDDLLAEVGPDKVLELFQNAEDPPAAKKESQAELLIALASQSQLYHTPDGEAFARIQVGDHRENWPIRSTGFKRWMARRFYETQKKTPGSLAIQDALGLLEAKATYEGAEVPLHVRVAGDARIIYIDLCDESWRAIEVTGEGWRIVSDLPVRFRRSKGMLRLPEPSRDGSIDLLRGLINVGSERNWILCLSWLVAAFRPAGPFPILILQGEQGSAKSTMERLLKLIVDPSVAPIRTPARNEQDLLIAASNSRVIAYDNLSGIPHWLSDSLCRLATGGGFSTRELYTDREEVFFEASRPVILNGIDQLAERADLVDRAVILNLPVIPESHRRDEAQLYEEFNRNLPAILGSLLTAVSTALRRIGEIHLEQKPRMADFALWATAAESAFGFPQGAFISAYEGNRHEAVNDVLEGDPVATAISSLMGSVGGHYWEGCCQDLLTCLAPHVDESTRKSRSWPQTPRAISARLRRLITALRGWGIEISFAPRTGGQRTVLIRQKDRACDRH